MMRADVLSENSKSLFCENPAIKNSSDGNIRVIPKNMEEKRDGGSYAFFTGNLV